MSAYCHRCQRVTPTKYIPLPAGMGNCCAVCRTCRKGKPYISKHVYAEHLAKARNEGKGHRYDQTNRLT